MLSFVETRLFTSLIVRYLPDDEYAALQHALVQRPAMEAVIPGSGGVRKLRWGAAGRGKRAGLRVIYVSRPALGQMWMLTVYAKGEAGNIPAHVLRRIMEELDGEEQAQHRPRDSRRHS